MQQPWQQHDLDSERQGGREIQVRLARAPGEEQRGGKQHRSLHRQQVDQINDAALGEHREGQEQEQCGAQVEQLQIQRGTGHSQAPSSRCTRSPSTAKRNAVARNSGARNTRSFADTVSIKASSAPAAASFTPSSGIEASSAAGLLRPVDTPQGTKSAKPMQA